MLLEGSNTWQGNINISLQLPPLLAVEELTPKRRRLCCPASPRQTPLLAVVPSQRPGKDSLSGTVLLKQKENNS